MFLTVQYLVLKALNIETFLDLQALRLCKSHFKYWIRLSGAI